MASNDNEKIILLVIKYAIAYVMAPNKMDIGKAGNACLFNVKMRIVMHKPYLSQIRTNDDMST
jgi:hypothetical protein